MAEPARKTPDVGLDEGMARLTPEKIEKTINAVLGAAAGARLKVYVDTCVHCGLCSDACHYYLSHDNEPSWSPAGKVKRTMWEILNKKGKVSPEFIRQASEIASTECNLCRRCVHYCPMGIDIAYIMVMVRRICQRLGVTPQYIQDTCHSHSVTMNQMWVKEDEWIDTLFWQEEEAQDEFPNLRIPLDKEGADFMYSIIGPEPKFRAQLIYQAAAIFEEAGLDYTMPSNTGWDNSDMPMFTGEFEMMGRLKRDHFEAAEKLKVKKIVMGECGHAFRSVYDVGNRWLGWKMPPIPVIHSAQFFAELIKDGKIKVASKFDEVVTIQDPCNIVRGQGLHKDLRYVARAFCKDVVEMEPHGEHNFCCCAGGGVINCGPPFKNKRVESNRTKAEQLAGTGVKTIISPCHNCHGGIEDIIHHYKLGMHLKFLGDIIYEHMEKSTAA
ncbi:MAG: (Fe-S)-binding protein [Deltaproteobacteria bacterium]|nr:(Fe-S)-binding protein [Deltaproteobacteria bacterium]MBW2264862.1 (Fe-S)-binding protein [Deltaproteobacteria bacterium]MBW2317629.1 (Fe-S)-binding protein [Deltaproteobacteria bacterium]MBW2600692.1 (Fe-S)-binding protein [Deltaproteobacteria bacterium]